MKPVPRRLDLPTIFGVLDAAVGLAFAAHMPVAVWYPIAIAIKLILAISVRRSNNLRLLDLALLVALLILGLLTLATGERAVQDNYLQFGAFLASMALTLIQVGGGDLRIYLRSAFYTLTGTAAFHILWAKSGHEQSNFGRYYFFEQQPNLGAENAAIASVIGLYGPSRKQYWLGWGILVADVLMVQGRAALLTMAPALLVSISFSDQGNLQKRRLLIGSFVATLGAPVVYLLTRSEALHQGVSSSLALNSESRGLNSGFSGRDQLWAQAIDYFNSSPFIGHSLTRFGDDHYIGAHNYLLYGLAQFGLPFLAIIGILAAGYIMAARKQLFALVILLCATPLLLFNDRLVNLNAYPFLFYVVALKIGSSSKGIVSARRSMSMPRSRFTAARTAR